MEEQNKLSANIKEAIVSTINFNQHSTPLPIQRNKGGRLGNDVYTMYGADNLYPNFLLKLYDGSPIHKGIINSKVDYILGDGIVYADTMEEVDVMVNDTDTIQDFVNKITKDFVIFNYYAVEVTYNNMGMPVSYVHLPAHKIRSNANKTKFWYSEDWYKKSADSVDFDKWDGNKLSGGEYPTKVFVYTAYTPSVGDVYPTPDYSGAIKSIETDMAIRDFHINNINNNFSVSSIITFFNGEPPLEIKDDIEDAIKGSYTGTKGGKIIINYANQEGKSAEVKNISPTDWNDAYMTLKSDTMQDIIIAHSATSPMLFGIKTEGQLGGASELETAYQIFKRVYVNGKRSEIVRSLNNLFYGIYRTIDIKDMDSLFKAELSDATKEKIYTINELREMDGKPPLEGGDRLLSEPVVVTEDAIQKAERNEFSKSSEAPNFRLTEADYERIADLGEEKVSYVTLSKSKLNFASYTDKLEDYLLENKLTGKTVKSIQSALEAEGTSYSIEDIKTTVAKLVVSRAIPNTGIVAPNDIAKAERALNILAGELPKTGISNLPETLRKVEIRYSYEGVADSKNRAFCHRLVRANKLYSREDIQKMSEIFGYDVWTYCGGRNCRHKWNTNKVVRRDV